MARTSAGIDDRDLWPGRTAVAFASHLDHVTKMWSEPGTRHLWSGKSHSSSLLWSFRKFPRKIRQISRTVAPRTAWPTTCTC